MPISYTDMIADYEFWIKFDAWNVEQMTALLLGYNPLYFDRRLVDKLSQGEVETSMSPEEIQKLVAEYYRMNALILESIENGKLATRVSPLVCYKWTQRKGIPVFTEFHQAIQNFKPRSNPHGQNRGFSLNRKKQLYKIVLSMAIKYKFHPDNNKNPSTSKFRDAIHRAGLNIDDNTIRDVVKKSYELFKDEIDQSIFEN